MKTGWRGRGEFSPNLIAKRSAFFGLLIACFAGSNLVIVKKIFKIILGIGACLGILFLASILFLMWGMRVRLGKCEIGPLAEIHQCELDHSTFTWMGSGWWYTKAVGSPNPMLCQAATRGDCEPLLGQSSFTKCESKSRLASNGNTTYYEITAYNENCTQALYFKGSKRTISEGKVREAR